MKLSSCLQSPLLAAVLLAAAPAFAALPTLPLQRLLPTTAATTNQELGKSVAISDHYIVAGAPVETYAAPGKPSVAASGAVHVFRAGTGAYVKRIFSPTPQAGSLFGAAVAVDATTLYVSAPSEDTTIADRGAIYAIDIATGALRWKYSNPALIQAGITLAVSGKHVVVGCPFASSINGSVAYSGQVLVLQALNGTLATALEQSPPESNANFGTCVAVDGSLLVASAPFATAALKASAGLVELFDLETLTSISEVSDTTPAAGAQFGSTLAIQGTMIAIGRRIFPYNVLLYDSHTQTWIRTINDPDGLGTGTALAFCGDTLASRGPYPSSIIALFDRHTGARTGFIDHQLGAIDLSFGSALASNLNSIALGAPAWLDKGVTQGAVFVTRSVRATLPGLTVLARSGDYAPVAGASTYTSITDQTWNGATATWSGALSGPATQRKGVWNRLGDQTDLPMRQGDTLGAAGKVADIVSTYSTSNFYSMIQARTATARTALWFDDSSTLTRGFQEGEVFTSGGLVASKLVVATGSFIPLVQATAKVGVAGVKATDDSVVAQWDFANTTMKVLAREGGTSPVVGRALGQFAPRLTAAFNQACISASLQGGTATDNQALFYVNSAGTQTLIAQRGAVAPGTAGALYSQFLGEQNTSGNAILMTFRATLSGGPVTTNEGIFSGHKFQGMTLVARKGGQPPGIPGKVGAASFTRFIRTFEANSVAGDLMFHAAISGLNINATNDEAVWLYQGFGSAREIVLREGDPAPGCGGARIGVIQRMEVDVFGRYYILASLTGAATGTDQVLLVGNQFMPTPAGRRPYLALRKGMLVNRAGAEQIKSINFSPRSVNAQGFGAPDVCQQLGTNGLLFTLTYADNSTELVAGWPNNTAP